MGSFRGHLALGMVLASTTWAAQSARPIPRVHLEPERQRTAVARDSGAGPQIPDEPGGGTLTSDGPYCSVNSNSTGLPALISVSGSTSIEAAGLTLSAMPLPSNKAYVFVFGPCRGHTPFGNGFLCIRGGVTPVWQSGFARGGMAVVTPDLRALGVQPGPIHFQCWYRDPASGGSAFNTSDAYQITLTP